MYYSNIQPATFLRRPNRFIAYIEVDGREEVCHVKNTGRCKELLTDILREEWGFGGMVSTDWHVYSEQYKEIKAGNDLRMPGGFPYRLMEAMDRGLIAREEIETSVKRILQVILRLE